MTCRSIPSADWEHARQVLIFYFLRRGGISHAEDLAHDTLTAFWTREDYEFASAEDFLRICRAFAGRILKAYFRKARKHAVAELGEWVAAPDARVMGLTQIELGVVLDQILNMAKDGLSAEEWRAIEKKIDQALGFDEIEAPEQDERAKNQARVRLFRARAKLSGLADWPRE